MKMVVFGFLLVLAQACGKGGDGTVALPNVPSTPTDAQSTLSYAYGDWVHVCDALKNWKPDIANIQFPVNTSGSVVYTFKNSGIYQNAIRLIDMQINIFSGTPVCIALVQNGKLVQVQ